MTKQVEVIPTHIKSIDGAQELVLYPNPSSGVFSVAVLPLLKLERIQIYDAVGKQVAFETKSSEENLLEIMIMEPVPGIFFFEAYSKSGQVFRKQIAIEH